MQSSAFSSCWRAGACRSKLLADGQRLITDLILPGDISHVQTSLLGYADHFRDHAECGLIAEINPAEIAEAVQGRPGIAQAFRWSSLQTDSILRQWLINNGRRLAAPRLAHLICEIQLGYKLLACQSKMVFPGRCDRKNSPTPRA